MFSAHQKNRKRRVYEGEPHRLIPRAIFHFHRKRRKIWRRILAAFSPLLPHDTQLSWHERLAIRLLFKKYTLYVTGYRAAAKRIWRIAPPTKCAVVEPREIVGGGETRFQECPGIDCFEFINVEAHSGASALVSGSRVCLPQIYTDNERITISDGTFLLNYAHNKRGLVYRSAVTAHDDGVMLFGSGSRNWYHWLIEVLPAAFFTQRMGPAFSQVPLVIPEEVLGISTFMESLRIFQGGRPVVTIGAEGCLFHRLIVVEGLTREPMNMRPGYWPTKQDYAYHPELLMEYRDEIFSRLNIRRALPTERLFLARPRGRRTYNQDELIVIAQQHGFTVVHMETLSFAQQVDIMQRAAVVVGPSGAAFANTLFCQEGTKLLSWLLPEYGGFCSYTNIAYALNIDIQYISARSERPLVSTFDGFSADYFVSKDDFSDALRKAITHTYQA